MKKIIRRGAAATLAAVTLVTSAAVPVRAAAPRVQVDETMYVNLDYYGTATQINVVKGCTTNGLTEYTDYGTYAKVVNMTDDTAPEIGDGTVTWKLPEKNSRFYYQCTMPKNSVDLPWTFDVSYKLNGVEADASKLAGASGLVEVNVKATPNEKAKAYYKNNMVLTVLVPVDMEKCYSVDAPGAQVQSVGSYQAAMFAALPGEDGDFTVRVGTDNYENIGVIMMMVPGTLDELNRIKDLKEAKDTWREDGNKMYDSMNALLKTMESMKSDVSGVKGGLANLDQARGTVRLQQHLCAAELAVVVVAHGKAVCTGIMDDQQIADVDARQYPVDGKLVIVLTQTADNVVLVVAGRVLLAHDRDMVIRPVHGRTHQVTCAGICADVLLIDVLCVDRARHEMTVRCEHKAAEFGVQRHITHAGRHKDLLIRPAHAFADDGDVIGRLIRPVRDTDAAGEVNERDMAAGLLLQLRRQPEKHTRQRGIVFV